MSARIMLGGACALGLVVAAALAGPQGAEARECAVKPPPDATGHWVYRTVEGRKCWYRGPEVIPKSELHWPKDVAATEPADAEPAKPETAKPEAAKSESVTTEPVAVETKDERAKALDANAQFLRPDLTSRFQLGLPQPNSPQPGFSPGSPASAGTSSAPAARHVIHRDSFDARWHGEPR